LKHLKQKSGEEYGSGSGSGWGDGSGDGSGNNSGYKDGSGYDGGSGNGSGSGYGWEIEVMIIDQNMDCLPLLLGAIVTEEGQQYLETKFR